MKYDLTFVGLFTAFFFVFGLAPTVRDSTMNLLLLVAVVYLVVAFFLPKQLINIFLGLGLAYLLKMVLPYQYRMDGFRDVDCQGITCPEGKFCQNNTCKNIYVGGPVPTGNE